MLDVLTLVKQLKRPPLLVRTARIGVDGYQREAALNRLIHADASIGSGEALMHLLDAEKVIDDKRRASAADYTIAHHVDMLIAIMGEARALRHKAEAGALRLVR